jgi:hypothetical protein
MEYQIAQWVRPAWFRALFSGRTLGLTPVVPNLTRKQFHLCHINGIKASL